MGLLFQGAMVSTMIVIPAKALSISPCTRSTSDFRNTCNSWSSEVSPSSPSIELDVNRAREDLIRSISLSIFLGEDFGSSCSTNLLISVSKSDVMGADFSADVEPSMLHLCIGFATKSNDISRQVNKSFLVGLSPLRQNSRSIAARQLRENETRMIRL